MKIIIDADACPKNVIKSCKKAAKEYSLSLHTIANFNHNIDSVRHTTVGDSPQEVDLEIINITGKNDIVITQDWGLAALVLGKGASAISPRGRIYYPETIDFLLEEREVKAKQRRSGIRTRGPRKRTKNDDTLFYENLVKIIKLQLYSNPKNDKS